MMRAQGWLFALVLAAPAWGQQDAAKEEEKKKDDEAKAKIAEFNKDLKTAKTPKDQADKVASLGSLKHPRILSELKGYLKHPSSEVAIEAASQISKYEKDKDAAESLVNGVNLRRDKDTQVKCVRYAGDVGYRGITKQLVALTRHKEVDVAREAVDSMAKLKSKDSIEPLLALWKDLDQIRDDKDTGGGGGLGGLGGGVGGVNPTNAIQDESKKRKNDLTPAVESALEKISGEDFKTQKEASDWWRRAKATFKEPE
jgi:hypothetical protein